MVGTGATVWAASPSQSGFSVSFVGAEDAGRSLMVETVANPDGIDGLYPARSAEFAKKFGVEVVDFAKLAGCDAFVTEGSLLCSTVSFFAVDADWSGVGGTIATLGGTASAWFDIGGTESLSTSALGGAIVGSRAKPLDFSVSLTTVGVFCKALVVVSTLAVFAKENGKNAIGGSFAAL